MASIYRPLNSNSLEIRLLVLLPGDEPSPIKCKITYTLLDQAQEYEALSYTWGDASNCKEIMLEEYPFRVTSNLESALRHLREKTTERILWIDALCINKEVIPEKAEQIPLMRQIYTTAKRVLSWIGDADGDSDTAMSNIQDIGMLIEKNEAAFDDETDLGISPQFFTSRGLDVQSMKWQAILSLWDRPYWTRAWVLQELVTCGVGSSEDRDRCLAGCGSKWIAKRHLDRALGVALMIYSYPITWLDGNATFTEPLRSIIRHQVVPPAMLMLQTQLQFQMEEEDSMTIDWVMREAFNLKATDPRDKIYSLLGLFPELRDKLVTDYTSPVEQVYMDFVEFCIQDRQDLGCLMGNRTGPPPFGPSWIPAFSGVAYSGPSWLQQNKQFKASGSRPANIALDKQRGHLTLNGITIGIVDTVIGPFATVKNGLEGVINAKEAATAAGFDAHYKKLLDFHRSLADSQHEHFWRAMVFDQDIQNVLEPKVPAPKEFEPMYRVLFGVDPLPADFAPELDREQRLMRYVRPFLENMEKNQIDRCVIGTENEKIGWGPCDTRIGDVVVILEGGALCLLLRPRGDFYQLMGDAFIQGVMDGKYFEEYASGQGTLERFTLS